MILEINYPENQPLVRNTKLVERGHQLLLLVAKPVLWLKIELHQLKHMQLENFFALISVGYISLVYR